LSFYEEVGVLKIEESESEVLKIEELESEVLGTDSKALVIQLFYTELSTGPDMGGGEGRDFCKLLLSRAVPGFSRQVCCGVPQSLAVNDDTVQQRGPKQIPIAFFKNLGPFA
jgi:hypothetical protein